MSLWLIANTVARDAVDILVTNGSGTEASEAQSQGVDIIKGGPRSFKWTHPVEASGNRITYWSKRENLNFRFCVLVDAKRQEGRVVRVRFYKEFFDTPVTVTERTIGSPYIGISGADYVIHHTSTLPILDADGIMLELSGLASESRDLRQVYFDLGLEFAKQSGGVQFERVPVWSPAVAHGGHHYKLHAIGRFTVGPMTRAVVDAYNDVPKHDPVFFYDDTGEAGYGDYLPHKLWHCVILSDDVEVDYTDGDGELLFINFEVGLLKSGSG